MCSHFNIEDGRKYATFLHIILYYFKTSKNSTEMQKKIYAVYREGAVTVKNGLQSFVLAISHGMMISGQVEQLKLMAIKSRY